MECALIKKALMDSLTDKEVKMKYFKDEKRNGCNRVSVLLMVVIMLSLCVQGAVVPVSTQTLELKPGWTLVTLMKPLDSKPVNLQKLLELKLVRYDVDCGAYVFCDRSEDVKAGVGYWVFSQKKQTIELALDVDSAVVQPTVTKGWNLVGMTDGASWPDSAVVIWGWQDGSFKPIEKKDLKVGNAYWAFFND